VNGEWTLDRWRAVDRLFDAALDRPEAEREAFVRIEAAGDAGVAAAVLGLLRAERESEGRFEAPGSGAFQDFVADLASRGSPTRRIGPYAIVRELGRGGMGTVYLGEREGDGFRQHAAIKVLRRGVDTEDLLRRFVTERRILASLSHPNIARLYDGGATDDGRPFLAMEYVDGEPITTHCDRRGLGVDQRLQLVLEVADAVRAAHANLVVHRDLKPSNILVTAEGRVKLLDFGIAKLLDAGERHGDTMAGSFLLTPDHASPEQLRGEPVTTATDVYQLGVLLFVLLTGQPPYRAAARSAADLPDLAGRLDIPRPSTVVAIGPEAAAAAHARGTTPRVLRRRLAGDLDTLVRKALHAEPDRRYGSVEALAGDIRRFLEGRPISARADSAGYRTRLFLRRHRWIAPVAAAAAIFLGAYAVTGIRHTRALERERRAATFEAQRAAEVQRFLVDLFASADPYAPADPTRGRDITVVEALDVGVDRLKDSLADRPAVRASILAAIAEVYQNLGVLDRALPLRVQALQLQQDTFGPVSREVRDSLGRLALIRSELGEPEAAGQLYEQRLGLVLSANPPDATEIADARIRMARHLVGSKRATDAEPHLREVLSAPQSGELPAAVMAEATRTLADVQRILGRLDESEATARRALALVDEALGANSVAAATSRGTLAQTLGLLGRVDEAEALFRAAIDTLGRTLGPHHGHRLATISNLSVLLLNAGDLTGAEELLREIVAIGERVHGAEHPSLAGYLQNHATVLVRIGRLDEARVRYERAAGIYRETLDATNHARALPLLSLAGLHLRQNRPPAAEAAAREALEILRRALPGGHFITAVAECRVARALMAGSRMAEAGAHFDRATPPLIAPGSVPEYRRECLSAAARFYASRGDRAEAARLKAALGDSGG